MTEEQALLAAILAQPEDDTVRLVYADWLDENGRRLIASCIRCHIELARCERPGGMRQVTGWLRGQREAYAKLMSAIGRTRSAYDKITKSVTESTQFVYELGVTGTEVVVNLMKSSGDTLPLTVIQKISYHFDRGFCFALTCPWEVWRDNADRFIRLNPLLSDVELTTQPDADAMQFDPDSFEYDMGEWLKSKWPGITFELPVGEDDYHIDETYNFVVTAPRRHFTLTGGA